MFVSLSSKVSLLVEPPTCVVTVIGQIIATKSKVVCMEAGLKLGKTEFSECSLKVCFYWVSPRICLVCLDCVDDTSLHSY